MITIREMKSSEIDRIAEINRTEHVKQYYTLKNGILEVNEVDWHVGPWDSEMKIQEWIPVAQGYENMWGAFDQDRLVGFAVYRSNLSDDMAQFSILHVSHDYRKMGIGTRLSEKVLGKARDDGKKSIYLTSTPTKTTVDFYRNLGFKLAEEVNEELYKLEPDDIHMIIQL